MQKFILSLHPWQKIMLQGICFVFTCVATGLFFLCGGAFYITNVDTPEHILIPLTTVLITLASFLDSVLLAKIFREKGIVIGLCTGTIFSLIIVIISAWYGNIAFTSIFVTKILSVIFAGILGGVLGVNS